MAEEGPRNAKADAAAAKAYAKAQRPWYKKKRWILSLGLILLIVIASAGSSGGGDDSSPDKADAPAQTSESTESPAKGEEPPPEPAPEKSSGPTSKLPQEDGDWRLDSIRLKDDGLGSFGGTARITYTGDTPGGTNIFTIAVFKGGKEVAALMGSADDVSPGDAETVQLISQDDFVSEPYEYDFQTDL